MIVALTLLSGGRNGVRVAAQPRWPVTTAYEKGRGQRDRAETNAEVARSAAHGLVFDHRPGLRIRQGFRLERSGESWTSAGGNGSKCRDSTRMTGRAAVRGRPRVGRVSDRFTRNFLVTPDEQWNDSVRRSRSGTVWQKLRTPVQPGWQRDLSVSYNKVGDVLVAQGDLPGR